MAERASWPVPDWLRADLIFMMLPFSPPVTDVCVAATPFVSLVPRPGAVPHAIAAVSFATDGAATSGT